MMRESNQIKYISFQSLDSDSFKDSIMSIGIQLQMGQRLNITRTSVAAFAVLLVSAVFVVYQLYNLTSQQKWAVISLHTG